MIQTDGRRVTVSRSLYQIQEKERNIKTRYNHGLWSIGTSGVSYLDTVAVNHEGYTIDTWQKAKRYFSKWHCGEYLLIWEDSRSFKVYHINIKRDEN